MIQFHHSCLCLLKKGNVTVDFFQRDFQTYPQLGNIYRSNLRRGLGNFLNAHDLGIQDFYKYGEETAFITSLDSVYPGLSLFLFVDGLRHIQPRIPLSSGPKDRLIEWNG